MTHVTPAVPVAGDGDLARLADPDYAVSPVFAVRVAGLPVAGLDRMRCTRTWRLVDELVNVSAWLRTEGADLSDPLHDVIGGTAPGPLRSGLLALRRAVFSGRRLSGGAASAEVLAALPEDLAARVGAWTAVRRRADELRAALPAVLAEESREKTALLRETVSDAGFRHGLAQGSPVLAGRLDAWLAGPADRPPERQELLRLARYLARAAVKTSPYATFTLSGLGRWEADGPAVRTGGEPAWHVVVELDRAVLRPLWAALTRHRRVRERARLRVNPSASDDGDRIWFLGAGQGEPLSGVPASPEVRAALDWVRGHPFPTLAAAPGIEPLADAGLLEFVAPYDEQGDDPVGRLASWLAEDGQAPYTQAVGRVAAALRDGVTRPGDGEQAAVVVREALREVLPPGPSLPDRNLLWHSAVIPGVAGRLSATAWRGVCDDLDKLRGLLGLFDPDLPVKVAATAFFLDRYGPGGRLPALDLYREIHREAPGEGGALLRGMLRDPIGGTRAIPDAEPPPGLVRLTELRRTFWEQAGAREPVVDLTPARLAAMADDWPSFVRPPGSICCYLQAVPGPGGMRAVVNSISAGYGRGLSRLHRLVVLAGGEAPPADELRAAQGDVLVAECRGLVGGGLNARPATADLALEHPFTAPDTRLPHVSPAELMVGYDAGGDRLTLFDGAGRPVRPVHLGMTAQYWLPPWLQFLVRTFGEPSTAMVPGWVFRTRGEGPDAGVVERWPRMDLGRVTFARAAWRLRAGAFPVPAKGEGEAAYLPRLAGWLALHEVPRRFFARVVSLREGLHVGLLSKDRKPMYVDVTDTLLLTGFLRTLRDPGALLVIEEALPDPSQAPRYGPGRRVTEYVVQVSARPAR
ncbi:lantibiotic dehydratase [Nonomuraea jiangxiensis]|uniref:Lantibiotic dehydratase, C terminus n=1 Tax=Nonomuraea jiangxiensis TaxID=633440 RepID=A0A1G9P1U1_9ACTN|nr:lantibiotic dehydratase [Nonomuraea jiangxiensis]SDL92836.1 Lantibiotic dehydratase, C terminus [Nonomuraea jiangxiensis]